jgi:two-component system chemotaxis sensor kinase CheA
LSTSNNADGFIQIFRDEAREILTELEAALLQLNEARSDLDLVGRVFRALHTIKGSGSMFGFDQLAAFTHDLETAFDEVRNGRMPVTSELIDLTLEALDQIKAMLEDHSDSSRADATVCKQILAKVKRMTAEPSDDTPLLRLSHLL